MKMKNNVIAICIALLLLNLVVGRGPGPSTISLIKTGTDPTTVKAGDLIELSLKLEMFDIADSENVTMTIMPEYPFSLRPGDSAYKEYGQLPGKAVVYEDYYLLVDKNAFEDSYPLNVIVCVKNCEFQSHETELEIDVEGDPKFYLKRVETPDTIVAGETIPVKVVIENQGNGPAYDVDVEVSTTPQGGTDNSLFSLPKSGNTFNLGTFTSETFKAIDFNLRISNTASGAYKLPITISYEDMTSSTTLYLDFVVENNPVIILDSISFDKDPLAGQNTGVTLAVKNVGTGVAEDVTIDLSTTPTGSIDTSLFSILKTGSQQYIGDLGIMDEAIIKYSLLISSNANGKYALPITLSYESLATPLTFSLNLNVKNTKPILRVLDVQHADNIEPGIKSQFSFKVRNGGTEDARNVRIKISALSAMAIGGEESTGDDGSAAMAAMGGSNAATMMMLSQMLSGITLPETTNGLVPLGSADHYADSIAPGEDIYREVPIMAARDTPEGTYKLNIETIYENELGTEFTDEFGLGLSVMGLAKIQSGKITSSPVKVRPGDDDVNLKLELVNTGTGTAKNIKLVLTSSQLDFKAGNDVVLGNLPRDETKEAEFTFDVPEETAPGEIPLTFALIFENSDGTTVKKEFVESFILRKKPILELEKVEFSDVYVDDEFSVKVTVKNTGMEEAESVSVKGILQGDLPYEFNKKNDYIGNIAPGETGVAVLDGTVTKSAIPKEYKMSFELRCVGDRDIGDTNVYLFERTTSFNIMAARAVTSSVANSINPLYIGALLLIIIGLYVFKSQK